MSVYLYVCVFVYVCVCVCVCVAGRCSGQDGKCDSDSSGMEISLNGKVSVVRFKV